MPTSPTSRLTGAFVSHLAIRDLPGYDLIWTFGDILQDVPARLGTHAALDAAANAIVATSPCLAVHTTTTTSMRVAYASGLRSLREALVPVEGSKAAVPIEIWLAVYLLWICQGWFGLVDDIDPGHARGLLRLWNVLVPGSFRGMDGFHRRVVCTMIMPVMLESLFDPTIILSAFVQSLAQEIDVAIAGDGIVEHIMHAPDACTPLTSQLWVAHCGFRIQEVLIRYDTHRAEASALSESGERLLAWLRVRIDDPSACNTPVGSCRGSFADHHDHATNLRTYSFASALLLLLNAAVLHRTPPDDPNERFRLLTQQINLIDDLIRAAKMAQQYRPLGSLGSTWALLIAWASLCWRQPSHPTALLSKAASFEKKAEIQTLLFQYEIVGINSRTHYMLQQAEGMFERLFPS